MFQETANKPQDQSYEKYNYPPSQVQVTNQEDYNTKSCA